MLLDAGADVNLAQESGLTPLAAAVIEGAAACVRHLLARGGDPELPDTDGFTPLMHAALHGRADSAAALVEAGAVLGAGPAGIGAKELAHVQGHQALVELIEGGDRKQLEKAAADKVKAERVVAAKEASERAAVERAATEKEREAANKMTGERVAVERAAVAEAAAEKQAAAELAAAVAVPPAIEAAAAAPAASEAESGASANLQAGERNTGRRTRCAAPTAGHLAPTRLEVVQEGDDVVVRLHAAEIVRLRSRGELTLSSGGWRTVSTLEAINGSVAELVPVRPQLHASTPDSAPAHHCVPVAQHPPPQHTHIGRVDTSGARLHERHRACRPPPATRHTRTASVLCWQTLKLELVKSASGVDWLLHDGSGTSVPFADGITLPTNVPNPLSAASIGSVGPSAPRAQPPADAAAADPRWQSTVREVAGGGAGGGAVAGNMQQIQALQVEPPPAVYACVWGSSACRVPVRHQLCRARALLVLPCVAPLRRVLPRLALALALPLPCPCLALALPLPCPCLALAPPRSTPSCLVEL